MERYIAMISFTQRAQRRTQSPQGNIQYMQVVFNQKQRSNTGSIKTSASLAIYFGLCVKKN